MFAPQLVKNDYQTNMNPVWMAKLPLKNFPDSIVSEILPHKKSKQNHLAHEDSPTGRRKLKSLGEMKKFPQSP